MIDLEQEIAEIRAALTEIAARLGRLEAAPDHDDVVNAPQFEYDRAAQDLPAS